MSAANVCVFVAEDRFQNRRDPMSHRIIEKRRRDRMNNCLADLSRLIPAIYLKKGRGRIEKTEIIEMAIKHLKHLQAHACKDPATCEVAQRIESDHRHQYRLGFHECMSECMRFLAEIEGLYTGEDLYMRLMNHLQKHFDKVQGHGFCYQLPPNAAAATSAVLVGVMGQATGVAPQNSATAGGMAISGTSNGAGGALLQQQQQQQQQQPPQPPPIQIHPPPVTGVVPMTEASANLLTADEDVKPMDLEPSESAFTRRSGGSFAPRGGLLQGASQIPATSAVDSVAQQIHHLMVPKQEGSAENSNGRPDSTERKPCPEGRSGAQSGGNPQTQHSSQLREMLRTPMTASSSHSGSGPLGLALCEPNMRKRSNTDTFISLSTISSTNHHHSSTMGSTSAAVGEVSPAKTANILQQQLSGGATNEEVYNFKKNIKERFQSNLRLFSASPTDSLDGDDSKGFTGHEERRYSHSQVQGPVASPHSPASFSRHTVSAPPIGELVDAEPAFPTADLSVNIEKNIRQSRESRDCGSREYRDGPVVKWEPTMSQLDSSNSAGSPPSSNNPSSRSSASSSGYSSNGSSVETGTRHLTASPPPPAPPVLAQALAGTKTVNGALNTSSVANLCSTGVPIFALHPKRSFYIPLTMEPSLLTPFLQADDDAGSPTLHPISISVNFNQLYRKNITATPQTPPWLCVRAAESRLLLPNGRL